MVNFLNHNQERWSKKLMSLSKEAIELDKLGLLARHMRQMEKHLPEDEVKLLLPNLLLIAGALNNRSCFEAVLPKMRNFNSATCQSIFSQLIENKNDSLRNVFLNHLKVYAPQSIYQKYNTDLLLEYGAKAGRMDVLDEAFENGAQLVCDEFGQNKPLCAAISAMKLDIVERLLKEKAPLKNSIIMMNSAFENAGHKNILPMIKLLLGHGMEVQGAQQHTISRFMLQSQDMSEETGRQIDELLEAWQERKKYIKYPVRFKDTVTIKDLTASVTPPETGYEPLPCIFKKTTTLHRLASADRFEEAIAISEKTGEPLTYEHLTRRDLNGNSVIDILGARNTLNLLERCPLAKGQEGLFLSLINDMPPIYRCQIDAGRIKHALTARTLDRVPRRNVALRRRTL